MTKTKTTEDLLKDNQQLLQFTQNALTKVSLELKRVKVAVSQLANFDPNDPNSLDPSSLGLGEAEANELREAYTDEEMEVIEGIFDGYYMVWVDQRKYLVPLNYSSKTKLIPGDTLKLKITPEGKMIYKLIKPAGRKHLKAILSKTDDQKFTAHSEEGQIYFLNQAAVNFHHGKPGDEVYIIINEDGEGMFAAIEAVIKK